MSIAGFNQAMEQKPMQEPGRDQANVEDALWFELTDIGATEFLGYSLEQADAQVVALGVGGEAVNTAKADDVAF